MLYRIVFIMKKSRKLIICVLVVLIVISGVLIMQRINYDPNRFSVCVGPWTNEDGGSFEMLIFAQSGELSKKRQEQFDKIRSDLKSYDDEFKEKYTVPYDIKADYKIDGKRTVITYTGTATNAETKQTENINKVFEYDFLLVKNKADIQRAQPEQK